MRPTQELPVSPAAARRWPQSPWLKQHRQTLTLEVRGRCGTPVSLGYGEGVGGLAAPGGSRGDSSPHFQLPRPSHPLARGPSSSIRASCVAAAVSLWLHLPCSSKDLRGQGIQGPLPGKGASVTSAKSLLPRQGICLQGSGIRTWVPLGPLFGRPVLTCGQFLQDWDTPRRPPTLYRGGSPTVLSSSVLFRPLQPQSTRWSRSAQGSLPSWQPGECLGVLQDLQTAAPSLRCKWISWAGNHRCAVWKARERRKESPLQMRSTQEQPSPGQRPEMAGEKSCPHPWGPCFGPWPPDSFSGAQKNPWGLRLVGNGCSPRASP